MQRNAETKPPPSQSWRHAKAPCGHRQSCTGRASRSAPCRGLSAHHQADAPLLIVLRPLLERPFATLSHGPGGEQNGHGVAAGGGELRKSGDGGAWVIHTRVCGEEEGW